MKPNALSARAGALCLIAASLSACSNKVTPTPDKEPPPPSAQPSGQPSAGIVSPSPSAAAEEAPAIPTLALEKFAPEGVNLESLYAVEGALMVVSNFRVGRIAGESIEWLKKEIPREFTAFGPNTIDAVHGRWPDSIGVVYSNTNGRASNPTYVPMTGVGMQHEAAPGSHGEIFGVARLGESTVVAGKSYNGVEFATVRGTASRKPQTPEEAGCKGGKPEYGPVLPAIDPEVIESTPAGTLVSIGKLCGEPTVAAEVWMRPCDSVSGTRCTRWVPDSNFSLANAPRPLTLATISL